MADVVKAVLRFKEQWRFSVDGSFNPANAATNHDKGTPTKVLFTLAGVANGDARQSDKANLGADLAPVHQVWASLDWSGETPSQSSVVPLYWMPSLNSTAANDNLLGGSGIDADAPNGVLGSASLADLEFVAMFIGNFKVHDGVAVQNQFIEYFYPPSQYGQILAVNKSGDVFEDDDVEMAVWIDAYSWVQVS